MSSSAIVIWVVSVLKLLLFRKIFLLPRLRRGAMHHPSLNQKNIEHSSWLFIKTLWKFLVFNYKALRVLLSCWHPSQYTINSGFLTAFSSRISLSESFLFYDYLDLFYYFFFLETLPFLRPQKGHLCWLHFMNTITFLSTKNVNKQEPQHTNCLSLIDIISAWCISINHFCCLQILYKLQKQGYHARLPIFQQHKPRYITVFIIQTLAICWIVSIMIDDLSLSSVGLENYGVGKWLLSAKFLNFVILAVSQPKQKHENRISLKLTCNIFII